MLAVSFLALPSAEVACRMAARTLRAKRSASSTEQFGTINANSSPPSLENSAPGGRTCLI